MEYYYDIELNFNDYPIHYYEWNSSDNIERLLRIGVLRVNSVSDIIEYNCSVSLCDGKYILCDLVTSIAIEVINGRVVYLSYLKYSDDNFICKKVIDMKISDLDIIKYDKRYCSFNLRVDDIIKNKLLNIVINGSSDLVKYIYYEVVGSIDSNINYKEYLINDIKNNFNELYYELYEVIEK